MVSSSAPAWLTRVTVSTPASGPMKIIDAASIITMPTTATAATSRKTSPERTTIDIPIAQITCKTNRE